MRVEKSIENKIQSDKYMKYSICLPVYNGAEFIAKAIDSVISQTYENWELVIYNNGSTDDTSKIINAYIDSRIRIVEEEQKAGSAIPSWHKAMSLASGDYVLMLGHDDWFNPNFLEAADQHIRKHELDVFSGWMVCFDPDYRLSEVTTSSSFIEILPRDEKDGNLHVFDGNAYIEGFLRSFKSGFSKMHLSTTLMRRYLYESVGGFNTELQYCAESELYLKLAHAGAKFGFLFHHPLVNYIGEGAKRRAHTLAVSRRYHDFYRIPKIMLESGMVDEDAYRKMRHKINCEAVQASWGYNFLDAVANLKRYNSATSYMIWLILLLLVGAYVRVRSVANRLVKILLDHAPK